MFSSEFNLFKDTDESASISELGDLDRASFLFGLNSEEFQNYLCNPKVLIGNEWVEKKQTVQQVLFSKSLIYDIILYNISEKIC